MKKLETLLKLNNLRIEAELLKNESYKLLCCYDNKQPVKNYKKCKKTLKSIEKQIFNLLTNINLKTTKNEN